MPSFVDAWSAMDFLVSAIADEAELQGTPLAPVERKMLWFSETAPTIPDIMQVNDAFDREFDQGEYEKKISGLINKLQQRFRTSDENALRTWQHAIRALGKLDYYLVVMVNPAAVDRSRADLLKLFATAILIVAAIVAWALFRS